MNNPTINFYRTSTWVLLYVVSLLLFIGFVSLLELNKFKLKRVCSSFDSGKDAQKFLTEYPSLDRNHDGIACNSLK